MFSRVKLDISVLGYGIYLAFTATALWGGVFPFFPVEFRTAQSTFVFVISQSLAFCAMLLLYMTYSFFRPSTMRRMSVLFDVVPAFFGSVMLIAALYLPDLQEGLVVAAGVLLGVGSAGFAMMWQRYFSAVSPEEGNYRLLMGTVCGSSVYFALCLVPIAVTVYLVPLVFIPLCGLCTVLATRAINFAQPIFEDTPREHVNIYVRMVRDHWKSAAGIGSLGFVSGLVRATALSNAALGDVVSMATVVGSLAAAVALLAVWYRGTFRIDIRNVYLVVFPLAACGLMVFPFFRSDELYLLAGCIYMLFMLVLLVMLLQCVQISHDRGINPLFVFGFFGSIVYLLQDAGIALGYFSNMTLQFGYGNLFVVALAGMFVLGMSLYLMRGGAHVSKLETAAVEHIEFISLREDDAHEAQMATRSQGEVWPMAEGELEHVLAPEDVREGIRLSNSPEEEQGRAPEPAEEPAADGRLQDRTSKRCLVLQERYRLTNRETEIMEMLARGNSMPRISEVLVISENTVRTHAKHIYTKLGIHKRNELLELLEGE